MIYSKDQKKLNNTKEKANNKNKLDMATWLQFSEKIKGWTTNNKT